MASGVIVLHFMFLTFTASYFSFGNRWADVFPCGCIDFMGCTPCVVMSTFVRAFFYGGLSKSPERIKMRVHGEWLFSDERAVNL